MRVHTKTAGVMAVLGASIMWALEPVVAKLSYENADFLQTSTIRAIFVTLTAFVYVLFTRRNALFIQKKSIPPLVYLAVVGTIFADVLYFYALTEIPVVNAVLLGHMQPVFIILIAFFVLKEETLSRFDYLGVLCMMGAGFLVTTRTAGNLASLQFGTVGDALVLFATVSWATTAIAVKKYLSTMHAGVLTFYRFLFASLAFVAYACATHSFSLSNPYQVLVGVIVGVGTILYYEGLKRIKAAQVSALELATPFFAAVLGFFILGEFITIMQAAGIAMLFVGIYLLSRKEEAIIKL
ncbi:MAG TPA: DMT family transporter [Thermoplasmatales archaeon]|nr:DMT family transporter [Thermoplasmatales archaeon]